jgi:hypothetical protein
MHNIGGGGSILRPLLFEPLPERGIAAATRTKAQSGAVRRSEGSDKPLHRPSSGDVLGKAMLL